MCIAPILALLTASPVPIPVAVPDRKEPVSYSREVADILVAKCVGCHGEALAEGKLNLEEVPGMLRGGKHGPAIVPGKADESLLFRMASHAVEPVMPPEKKKDLPPLTPEELGLLKLWIDAGAKDDSAEGAPTTPAVELGALPPGVHPIVAVDMTADGALVAFGGANVVHVVDVASGREVASLGGHKDIIQSLRFSLDGTKLAAGSYQVVTVWSAPAGGAAGMFAGPGDRLRALAASADAATPGLRTLGPHASRVLALDFSPDGTLLAAGGGDPSRSGEVKIWDVARAEPVRTLDSLHSDTVFGVRFSPDGTKLATCAADRLVKVVDLADGKELRTFEGHTHHVLAVDWKSDGSRLVTGGADNVLKVWDLATGEQLRTLRPAGKQVTAVRWVPGKPDVAGASGDKLVRLWNADTGNITRTFTGPDDFVFGVATSKDGARIAAGGADGTLFLWDGQNAQVLRKFDSTQFNLPSQILSPKL